MRWRWPSFAAPTAPSHAAPVGVSGMTSRLPLKMVWMARGHVRRSTGQSVIRALPPVKHTAGHKDAGAALRPISAVSILSRIGDGLRPEHHGWGSALRVEVREWFGDGLV